MRRGSLESHAPMNDLVSPHTLSISNGLQSHIGSLCCPNYTGRGSGRIETRMGTMTLMSSSELAMDLRIQLIGMVGLSRDRKAPCPVGYRQSTIRFAHVGRCAKNPEIYIELTPPLGQA